MKKTPLNHITLITSIRTIRFDRKKTPQNYFWQEQKQSNIEEKDVQQIYI